MDVDLEPVMREALTKGDPKLVLSILLTIVVMSLREGAFAKVQMKGRLGDMLRWLGTTHWGGVLSSMVGSGLGAVITALSTKTMPSAGVLLNAIFIAAAASGVSTWMKWKKHGADKIANGTSSGEKDPEPLPPPPPAGPPAAGLLLIMSGALALSACATLKDGLIGLKGEASFATLNGAREVLTWDKAAQIKIANEAPTREAVDAGLKEQRHKRDVILDGFASTADAIRVLGNAIDAWDSVKDRDWLKLASAVLDAISATRNTLARYNVDVKLPDLKLPKLLGGAR